MVHFLPSYEAQILCPKLQFINIKQIDLQHHFDVVLVFSTIISQPVIEKDLL